MRMQGSMKYEGGGHIRGKTYVIVLSKICTVRDIQRKLYK